LPQDLARAAGVEIAGHREDSAHSAALKFGCEDGRFLHRGECVHSNHFHSCRKPVVRRARNGQLAFRTFVKLDGAANQDARCEALLVQLACLDYSGAAPVTREYKDRVGLFGFVAGYQEAAKGAKQRCSGKESDQDYEQEGEEDNTETGQAQP
jgi:hypothetical protein